MSLPTKISDATRRLNPQIYGGAQFERGSVMPDAPQITQRKRIRQDSAGLNQTEAAFLLHLQGMYASNRVYAQALTFRLGNGVRYTPDFIVRTEDGQLLAYEVKGGFARDDAIVKLKVAAGMYPWIAYYLATKNKYAHTGWTIEVVYR